MTRGKLRAVVCTSSLDLGVDWGDIDLVINVGAPKGASRLLQRIGRANHRLEEPSRAVLIPANRFEVLECRVAIDAVADNAQDTPPLRPGGLDVLAQHVLGTACGAPFPSDELYAEVKTAAPYAELSRKDFDDIVDFVATGGYALKAYERFAKIRKRPDGRWRITHPRVAQSYRMNVGTIVEEAMVKVRLVRARGGRGGYSGADRARRTAARRGRGIFHRATGARRHVRVRRRSIALRGAGQGRGLCLARQCDRSESAGLRGRQVSALHLLGRPRSQAAGRSVRLGAAARSGTRMAGNPAMALAGARPAAVPGRDLPARRQALSRLLSVRGPSGAPDARHAAHPPARARAAAPARLPGQRICARRVGPRRCRAGDRARRFSRWEICSTRTCSATTSKPGCTSPR